MCRQFHRGEYLGMKGPLGAIKAIARKIAVIFYNVMTKGIEFVEEGIKLYEQKIKNDK